MPVQSINRRDFLGLSSAAVAAMTISSPGTAAEPAPKPADTDIAFSSATDAARAIRRGDVSAMELTELMLTRIEKLNPSINAIVSIDPEGARRAAKSADEALARGEWLGPLHGVPIAIKDTFEVSGMKTTAGSPEMANYVSANDAPVVSRLRHAGAVILGKTNVPLFAADMQTFNKVYGTTNNPWDVTRSSGGSTGGGAAALAAGLIYLSNGSDIGGSIRNPSHFCGVFGHKPTYDLVPTRGELASLPEGQPYPADNLSVGGVLARSASDLRLGLELIGGPDTPDSIAYQWRMPQPRATRLRDLRIGYVFDDPLCPVTQEVKDELNKTVDALKQAGAQVDEGWPEGIVARDQYATYAYLLLCSYAERMSDKDLAKMRMLAKGDKIDLLTMRAKAFTDPVFGYQEALRDRLRHRDAWQRYFQTYDAFLLPTAFTTAFEHVHTEPLEFRTIKTSLGTRAYTDLLFWISFATMTGLPATVAPLGAAANKLPVGVQILGPYLEDATPISVAGSLSDIFGGFTAPANFV